MLRRSLGALIVALMVVGFGFGEETVGTLAKIEDGSITIRTGGGFGKDKAKAKAEEKTFKIGKDVKITRVAGKDKEEVTLTLEELKVAHKVTNVFVTVNHDGDVGKELKVGARFGAGGGKRGKDKKKDDK